MGRTRRGLWEHLEAILKLLVSSGTLAHGPYIWNSPSLKVLNGRGWMVREDLDEIPSLQKVGLDDTQGPFGLYYLGLVGAGVE